MRLEIIGAGLSWYETIPALCRSSNMVCTCSFRGRGMGWYFWCFLISLSLSSIVASRISVFPTSRLDLANTGRCCRSMSLALVWCSALRWDRSTSEMISSSDFGCSEEGISNLLKS